MEYRPTEWDARAQQLWRSLDVYRADFPSDRNPFYVLDMFPYPSGAGLHVGHPLGYIASDIVSRFKRHQGFNVLHPMGFDAFGLPAEQYAIQTGQHPAVTTEVNIERYREQLNRLGLGFDWSREVQTCDPDYYRWTQWIFIQLFGAWYNKQSERAEPIETLVAHLTARGTEDLNAACHGEPQCSAAEWAAMDAAQREALLQHFRLAYRSESLVNWCPALGTVLANDEVVNGLSERGGHPVVQKPMLQWSMRISAFAQRLLDGLDDLNWSDSIKESQRHWIGRSQGARIRFKVLAGEAGEAGEVTGNQSLVTGEAGGAREATSNEQPAKRAKPAKQPATSNQKPAERAKPAEPTCLKCFLPAPIPFLAPRLWWSLPSIRCSGSGRPRPSGPKWRPTASRRHAAASATARPIRRPWVECSREHMWSIRSRGLRFRCGPVTMC